MITCMAIGSCSPQYIFFKDGMTALQLAETKGHRETVTLLQRHTAVDLDGDECFDVTHHNSESGGDDSQGEIALTQGSGVTQQGVFWRLKRNRLKNKLVSKHLSLVF